MSFYTSFCSTVIFPLHEALKKHSTVKVRRGMERSQWLKPDEIRQLQLQHLRAFLQDVQIHVPYYRQLFATLGFEPADLDSVKKLAELPLLSKPEIRQHLDEMKADDAKRLARFNTGGSSGEPLIFYIGSRRVSHDVAAK